MTNLMASSAGAAVRRAVAPLAAALALAGLGGCAIGPNPRDPFEPFNRKMMEFNENLDSIALKPAATLYRDAVPPLVRTGVNNFFSNLGDAWSGVNALLQLHLGDAGENFLRFGFNTLFGFAGVLDIASELNVERHKEDFGQTLGRWGVPAGPFVMLPFFGPSTVRDTFAVPVDRWGDPVFHIDNWDARWSLYILRAVDTRSNLLRVTSVLSEAALDKYTFTRDAYLQRRRAEVLEGKPVPALRMRREPAPEKGVPGTSSDGYVPPEPDDSPPPQK